MLKIRRPLGRLIFNMGIAIPGKTVFLIETAPSILAWLFLTYIQNAKPWYGSSVRWCISWSDQIIPTKSFCRLESRKVWINAIPLTKKTVPVRFPSLLMIKLNPRFDSWETYRNQSQQAFVWLMCMSTAHQVRSLKLSVTFQDFAHVSDAKSDDYS